MRKDWDDEEAHPLMILCLSLSVLLSPARACTNLLVTRGASQDGSVIFTSACGGEFHPILTCTAAADHEPGDSLEITDWAGGVRGKTGQVQHTCATLCLMNEYQRVIGETTFDSREELRNPQGLVHTWDLMQLALDRTRTARETIPAMTDLVAEYGCRLTGESYSIGDPDEVPILLIMW